MSYPILYEANATDFFNLGLGVLNEATSVRVTEERNGIFTLEMDYPISGQHFKKFTYNRIIKANAGHELKDQRFRIKRITKSTEDKQSVHIYAEHIRYLAGELAIKPEVFVANANGQAVLNGWKKAITDANPFTVYSDITTSNTLKLTWRDAQKADQVLGGVEGSILDKWGGEYKFDNYHVSLLKNRGVIAPTLLAYGRNITDLEQEENITNTYTSIMPYAIYTVDEKEELKYIPEYFVDSEHLSKYPNRNALPIDFSSEFDDENPPTVGQLIILAQEYIKNNNIGVPDVSVKVNFIDLSKTLDYQEYAPLEQVNLCDTVPIRYEKLGIDTSAKVVRTVWNVLADKYDEIEVGSKKASLSSIISDTQNAIKDVSKQTNVALVAANGKNIIFYGNYPAPGPTATHVGDMWFEPDGEYENFYIWDGAVWKFIMSTRGMADLIKEVEEAIKLAEEAKQAAEESYNKAVEEAEKQVEQAKNEWDNNLSQVENELKGDIEANAMKTQEALDKANQNASSIHTLGDTVEQVGKNTQIAIDNSLTAIEKVNENYEAIQAIEVSEYNLILNGGFYDGLTNWTSTFSGSDSVVLTNEGTLWLTRTTSATGQHLRAKLSDAIPMVKGEEFTLVMKARASIPSTIEWGFYNPSFGSLGNSFKAEIGTAWTTVQAPIKIINAWGWNATQLFLTSTNLPPGPFTLEIDWMKLVKANKTSSSFSSNPEDLQIQIGAINGQLIQKVSKDEFEALEQSVKHQETVIEQTVEEIKLSNQKIELLGDRMEYAETSLSVQSDKLSVLTTKMTETEGKVASLELSADRFDVSINTINSDLSTLGDSFSNLSLQVTGLFATVADKADLAELKLLSDQFSTTVSTLEDRIEKQGKNLILNGDFHKNLTNWKPDGVLVEVTAEKQLRMWGAVGNRIYNDSFRTEVGHRYRVTFEAVTSRNGVLKVGISGNTTDVLVKAGAMNTYIVDFTATNAYALSMYIGQADTVYRIDNVMFTEIPLDYSQFTQLVDMIDLRVVEADLISSINLSTEGVRINGSKIWLTGDVLIDTSWIDLLYADTVYTNYFNAKSITVIEANIDSIITNNLGANIITSKHIKASTALIDKLFAEEAYVQTLTSKQAFIQSIKAIDISANQITTGTLNGANVNVINLNASSITSGRINAANVDIINLNVNKLVGDTSSFVQSNWNSINSEIWIGSQSLDIYNAGQLAMQLTGGTGLKVWDTGTHIGNIGSSHWAGYPNFKGLVFQLDTYSDYMAWSYKETAAASVYTIKLAWYASDNPKIASHGFHFDDDVRINGQYKLYANNFSTRGYTTNGTVRFSRITLDGIGGTMITTVNENVGVFLGDNGRLALADRGRYFDFITRILNT